MGECLPAKEGLRLVPVATPPPPKNLVICGDLVGKIKCFGKTVTCPFGLPLSQGLPVDPWQASDSLQVFRSGFLSAQTKNMPK